MKNDCKNCKEYKTIFSGGLCHACHEKSKDCPECGSANVVEVDCHNCIGMGYLEYGDGNEDDYDETDRDDCPECNAYGFFNYCPDCVTNGSINRPGMLARLRKRLNGNWRVTVHSCAPSHPAWERTPYRGSIHYLVIYINTLAKDFDVWVHVENEVPTVYIWR